jgi:hypothetical protein
MILNVYCGEAIHVLESGTRRFRPVGPMLFAGGESGGGLLRASEMSAKDAKRLGKGSLSARLFVGLSVGNVARFTIDDVVAATVAFRKKAKKSPDASFIAQRGTYTHGRNGKLVVEDSVQVIILDFSGNKKAFVADMKKLGEALRKKFEQETVILEIQDRGIVQEVWGIT